MPLTTPIHNHPDSIYYNDHTFSYDRIHKNLLTPNTINFPTCSPLTSRPQSWPQNPIPSRPHNQFYNPTLQLHLALSPFFPYTQKHLPQTSPTSHKQTHSHRNQNLPSPKKTLSQTKQITFHSSLHTPPYTPFEHTPSTTTSCKKNQIRTLIRIQKNTLDSQAINTPTYSLPPLTPTSCPQKIIAACLHIKSHNSMPQVYPTLTPHIIPYTRTYKPQINPKLHKPTRPCKYRNLLSNNRILTKTKPITPNSSLYTSSNTPLSTTLVLIHLTLTHNNAHTLISIKTQMDTSTPQTICTKTSSPPPAKRKSWPQSLPNICPLKTTNDSTPQLPPAPDPHTFPHTQKYSPNLNLTSYEQQHSPCIRLCHLTKPSSHVQHNSHQIAIPTHLPISHTPRPQTLTIKSRLTSQSKDTNPPLTEYTHSTSYPSHPPHIPLSPTPHYCIHSQTITKPIPDFIYTQSRPLLNCHYLITKINTHFPPKPIFIPY